jgi:acyl carrier protein
LIQKVSDNLRVEIEEKIKQLLIVELAVSPAIVSNSSSSTPLLGRGIGLDSVETMALVVSLEEVFEISIPDDELTVDLFKNFGALTDYIMHALPNRTNGSGQ